MALANNSPTQQGGFKVEEVYQEEEGGGAASRWLPPQIPRSLGVAYKQFLGARNNCQRVLSTVEQTPTAGPTFQVKHAAHGAQSSQSHDVKNCRPIVQKCNRKSIPAVTGILLKHICCPKKNWRTLSCPRLEAVKQTPKEYTL
ncbi:hypothetical protein BB561_004976 [Smittium simulii]|uniref:Uncharacterized protein n=1 Tax=Smittium simulii TaxID=133385 RepID=A0A2T9YD09_9FUNG|nr:hypothetical protein BB561_004976 [Smittium simulii]